MILAMLICDTDFSAERYETVFDYTAFPRVFHVADDFQLHVDKAFRALAPYI